MNRAKGVPFGNTIKILVTLTRAIKLLYNNGSEQLLTYIGDKKQQLGGAEAIVTLFKKLSALTNLTSVLSNHNASGIYRFFLMLGLKNQLIVQKIK